MPKPTRSAGTPCHRKRPDPLTRPVTVLFPARVEPHSCLNPWSRRGRAGRRCLRSSSGLGLLWTEVRSPRLTNRPALRSRRYGGRLPMRALSPMPLIGFPHTVRGLPLMTVVRPYCWRGFCAGGGAPRRNRPQVMDRAWLRRLRGDGAGLDARRMAIRAVAAHPEPARTLFRAVGLCRCNASVSRPGGGIGKFWIRRAKRGLGSTVRR